MIVVVTGLVGLVYVYGNTVAGVVVCACAAPENAKAIDVAVTATSASLACFAALLGTEKNGYWQICPEGKGWKSTRRYRDHTLILETTFETDEGTARLIDFMPIREHNSDVVRIVEGIRGTVNLRMALSLRFGRARRIARRQQRRQAGAALRPTSGLKVRCRTARASAANATAAAGRRRPSAQQRMR